MKAQWLAKFWTISLFLGIACQHVDDHLANSLPGNDIDSDSASETASSSDSLSNELETDGAQDTEDDPISKDTQPEEDTFSDSSTVAHSDTDEELDEDSGVDSETDQPGETDSEDSDTYLPAGEYDWHTFFGSTEYEYSQRITKNDTGIFIGGTGHAEWNGPTGQEPIYGYVGYKDTFLMKLDIDGTYKWHSFFGTSKSDDFGDIASDNSSVYWVSKSLESWLGPNEEEPLHLGDWDVLNASSLAITKLDNDGNYQWHAFYGNRVDTFSAISVHGTDVYVTGESFHSWNGPNDEQPLKPFNDVISDIFVVKLTSDGAYQWHTFYGDKSEITPSDIFVDSGGVYVTGDSCSSWNGPNGELPLHEFKGLYCDMFVLKLDHSGKYHWHTFYGGEFTGYTSILVENDQIYIAGYTESAWNGDGDAEPLQAYVGESGTGDIFLINLNTDGQYQWHTFYGSDDYDGAYDMSIYQGDLYVAGDSTVNWNGPAGEEPLSPHVDGKINTVVVKFTTDGQYQWHTFQGEHGASGIIVDSDGIFVTSSGDHSWTGPNEEAPLNLYTGGLDTFVLKLK